MHCASQSRHYASKAATLLICKSVSGTSRSTHEGVKFHAHTHSDAPNPVEGLKIGYSLAFADGGLSELPLLVLSFIPVLNNNTHSVRDM